MISKNKLALSYALLSALMIGAAVFLAYQVRHFMYERVDPVAPLENLQLPPEEVAARIEADIARERDATLAVYSRTQSFAPLATPIPRPSPTPRPPASPTPVIPANEWKVLNTIGDKYANLQDYTGQKHFVKAGDTLTNRPNGINLDFKIVEISFNPPFVKVQDVTTGVTRVIPQEPKAARRPPQQRRRRE